jgi:hypothetical protein
MEDSGFAFLIFRLQKHRHYLCFTLRPAIFNSVMRLKPPYNYDEKEKAPQEYYLWGLNQLKK